jgi:RNA polymerase sigma-70 factor (ECF subfamily)
MERKLETLFESYARRGDVGALEQVFDRAAPELMKIALHLAHGAAQAEDLVQATFVRAIENAARFEPGRALLPWLIGILANEAARARRDGRRMLDPERLQQRSSADPVEESAGREISSQLASAVRALPSPYRDVLAPHLLEGERAVDIARKLERAPGTVRMQILRGLELLRKALPPSFAGAALLASGTRGHAAVREIVRARAAELAPSLAAPGTAVPTSILGKAAMS